MILFDWLKRQERKVKKKAEKYFVMQSWIWSDFFIDNFMDEE